MRKFAALALIALALAGCAASPAPESPYHADNLKGQPAIVHEFMACQWEALQESKGMTMAALHEACDFDSLGQVDQEQVQSYEFSFLK